MTALWVLGCVLLVLLLLSLVRVGGVLEYGPGGLRVRVRVGKLLFQVVPVKQKKKRPRKQKKESVVPRSAAARQENTLETLGEFLPVLTQAAGRLKRRIRVDRLDLDLRVGGGDPAAAAMAFGWANAALGVMLPMLENNFEVKERAIRTGVNFEGRSTEVLLEAALSLTVGQGAALGLFLAARLMKTILARRNAQKEAV